MTNYISFSTFAFPAAVVAILFTASSCKKSSNSPSAPAGASIIQDTINVQSIIGTNTDNQGLDGTRTGFVDLYDGVAYTQSEADQKSSDIDFAYNYHGGGCGSCRFFENVTSMSTRTIYVAGFSTVTNTQLVNAAYYNHVTVGAFDSIKTAANIDTLFVKYNINDLDELADVTNRQTDVSVGNVFAFIDKNGKKGFFEINDYVANVPDGDPAPLTLTVKIQK